MIKSNSVYIGLSVKIHEAVICSKECLGSFYSCKYGYLCENRHIPTRGACPRLSNQGTTTQLCDCTRTGNLSIPQYFTMLIDSASQHLCEVGTYIVTPDLVRRSWGIAAVLYPRSHNDSVEEHRTELNLSSQITPLDQTPSLSLLLQLCTSHQ